MPQTGIEPVPFRLPVMCLSPLQRLVILPTACITSCVLPWEILKFVRVFKGANHLYHM